MGKNTLRQYVLNQNRCKLLHNLPARAPEDALTLCWLVGFPAVFDPLRLPGLSKNKTSAITTQAIIIMAKLMPLSLEEFGPGTTDEENSSYNRVTAEFFFPSENKNAISEKKKSLKYFSMKCSDWSLILALRQ